MWRTPPNRHLCMTLVHWDMQVSSMGPEAARRRRESLVLQAWAPPLQELARRKSQQGSLHSVDGSVDAPPAAVSSRDASPAASRDASPVTSRDAAASRATAAAVLSSASGSPSGSRDEAVAAPMGRGVSAPGLALPGPASPWPQPQVMGTAGSGNTRKRGINEVSRQLAAQSGACCRRRLL